jgi:hypothetical protein
MASDDSHYNGATSKLENMGYKSELPRSLSMMSILGLSFAIMAVPFGISTSFAYPLTDGQSVTVLCGWIFVSFIYIIEHCSFFGRDLCCIPHR